MSTPFERYGIDHLSPSSINAFAASPALFVLERVMKRRQPVGAAAHRGNAVEHGVALGLNGKTVEECVAEAEAKYRMLTAMCGDHRKSAEAESISDMVRQGLKELRPYGEPSSTQGKVQHYVDGLGVPLIGFYDFEWIDHGILLDLKTTHKIPSKISTSHARQVALYRACRGDNLEARLSYVSTRKAVTYRLENAGEHIRALERIAFTIQRFLSISNDPAELAAIVSPDVDSFYFADPGARAAALEVFGI